jgi:DNA-binding NtrC family response regulator
MGTVQALELCRGATRVTEKLAPGGATTRAQDAALQITRIGATLPCSAFRLSDVNGFDVVFSDVVMPGMSGVELGHEIRRRYSSLPVVLTSGYSHVLAEEGRHGFELLQKPYAAEELSRVLRRVTRRQQHGQGE